MQSNYSESHTHEQDCILINECWRLGLYFAENYSADSAARIAELFARTSEAPAEIRETALPELLNFLELADPKTREALAAAGAVQPDACGCSTEGESVRRLRARFADADTVPAVVATAAPSRRACRSDSLTVALVVPQFLTAPSFLQPPLGALLAAARLRRMGHAVRLVDNRVQGLELPSLGRHVADCDAVAVITTPYDHIQNYFLDYRLRYALRSVDAIKAAAPDCRVLVCGAHGTVRPDIVFRDCAADYVIRGEFDTALPKAIAGLAAGDHEAADTECVARGDPLPAPGSNGAITPFRLVDLGERFRQRSVDPEDPRPAYDLISLSDYYGDAYDGVTHRRVSHWAVALATRGCAHDCSFCYNFWGRRVRYRDPEDVAEELAWLERDHGVRHVFFLDFNFTHSAKWIDAFTAAMRRRKVGLSWVAQTRCDAVTPAMLGAMKAAGCAGLWFGVESFDWAISSMLEKYRDPGATEKAIAMCEGAGIKPHLFIMIGLPGETIDSLNATIRAMHRHKAAFCGVMPTTPRFGTAHYTCATRDFPALGNDFYSLRAVRGLVGNELEPSDLTAAMAIMNDRRFVSEAVPPQLPVRPLRDRALV